MKRKKKGSSKMAVPVYGSDDDRTYDKEPVPDPTDDSYFQDEVDEFHASRDKILLDKGINLEPAGFSSDEKEEVLGLGSEDDDSDDEEIAGYKRQLSNFRRQGLLLKKGSDDEDDAEEEEDDLPDKKAWGQKRSKFYGADVEDDHREDHSDSEPDAAELEEQEALAIQKKMAEQLEDQDFGLDIFKTAKKPKTADVGEEKIKKDLSQLTKREKLQLLKKQSPELLDLIEDYKLKMTELQESLLPLLDLVKSGILPPSKGADYVQTKVRLYMNYCINISFYLTLKAKHAPVHSHPVIKRLVQYRNLIQQLEPVGEKVKGQVEDILDKVKNGEEILCTKKSALAAGTSKRKLKKLNSEPEKIIAKKKKLSEMMSDSSPSEDEDEEDNVAKGGRSWGRKKAKPEGRYETEDEQKALQMYEMMKGGRSSSKSHEDAETLGGEEDVVEEYEEGWAAGEENVEEGKRGITYEMAKNKGLTPHRKKELRNPRVKHRMKYRKAQIRRKGQIREPRKEIQKYSGEISGIRAGVKRSIKLK